jgi:uncharacterized protein (TIGR02996 family)
MTDDKALLAAILAEPDNDRVRLIYADWLEEHGDPARAEFIRLECELHGMLTPAGDAPYSWEQPRFRKLEARAGELWDAHAGRWFPGLETYAEEVETERGFAHHVALSARRFIEHGEKMFAVAPTIEDVFLDRLGRNTPVLAACPALAHVRDLTFFETPFRAREAEQFFASPFLGKLRSFEIGFTDTQMGPRGARALAECASLGALERLDVHNHAIYDEGAAALLRGERLATLRHLELGNNGLTDDTAEALAEAAHLDRLTYLSLTGNYLSGWGVRRLGQAEHLAGLGHLDLVDNPIDSPGLAALLAAPFAARLTVLRLGLCGLDDEGLASLLGSKSFPSLAELDLWDNLGEQALQALARNDTFTRLRSLDLGSCQLTPPLAGLLGQVRTLLGLRDLNLRKNPLGPEGVRRLLVGPLVRGLVKLDLGGCELGDEGAAVLAAASLPALRILWLADNSIGDAGAQALAATRAWPQIRSLYLRDNPLGKAGKRVLKDRFGDAVSF